jgi:hypothetical protein
MNYRIHVLDYRFQIMDSHDFVARDDITALDKGITFSAVNPIEIWENRRLVARIGMAGEAVGDRPCFSPDPHRKRAA